MGKRRDLLIDAAREGHQSGRIFERAAIVEMLSGWEGQIQPVPPFEASLAQDVPFRRGYLAALRDVRLVIGAGHQHGVTLAAGSES